MWKALVLKELRELSIVASIGLAAFLYYLALAVGYQLPAWSNHHVADVPFVSDGFVYEAAVVSFCLAVALGLTQSLAESMRGTWQWLLHRPVGRGQIIAVKLLVGAGVYLACAALPVACYACWAAAPGNHAGPFEWSMTGEAWGNCLWMLVVYLGGFLSGSFPGRWFGTRSLLLIGVAVLLGACFLLEHSALRWRLWSWVWFAFLVLACVYAVLFLIRNRDFS